MTTYYIRKTGSDSNNGTSPATAWQTIQKAFNAGAGPVGGDTIYIGAGTYRERVDPAMTSWSSTVNVIGDVTGAYTGDAGIVRWTAVTTEGYPATLALAPLVLQGRDYMAFRTIYFEGGSGDGGCVYGLVNESTNISFTDCVFINGKSDVSIVTISGNSGGALTWAFTRCAFYCRNGGGIGITAATAGADYSLGISLTNCLFEHMHYNGAIFLSSTGASSGKPGGVSAVNCTFRGDSYAMQIGLSGNGSTTYPSSCYNSIIDTFYGLRGAAVGQLVEDWNYNASLIPHSNVSVGANSVTSRSLPITFDAGASVLFGVGCAHPAMPLPGAKLLGYGAAASPPTTDMLNRPRPSGGQSLSNGVGALEAHDFGVPDTSTYDGAPNSARLDGPGDDALWVSVAANVATTISVKIRYDTTHATTTPPQLLLDDAPELGVTAQTVTAPSTANAWHTVSLSAITPAAAGLVRIRILARPAAAAGKCWYDSLTVNGLA